MLRSRRHVWCVLRLAVFLAATFFLSWASTWTMSRDAGRPHDDVKPSFVPPSILEPYTSLLEPDLDFDGCQIHCLARNARRSYAIASSSRCGEDDSWCSSLYDADTITAWCNVLCKAQYPANCTSARFVVLLNEYHTGIGSAMHMQTVSLSLALSEGRTLIYSPEIKSHWTFENDSHPPCARGSLECYYQPITHCSLPPDWKSRSVSATGILGNESDAQFITMFLAWTQYGDYNETTRPKMAALGKLSRLPMDWFKAQFVSFMYRPSQHMLSKVILPWTAKTFAGHPTWASRLLPERFISVFIRRGDKSKEAKLHEPIEYWRRIVDMSAKHNILDVYVASDSYLALDEVVSLAAASSLRVYHINATRYSKVKFGMGRANMMARYWGQARVRDLLNVALTDFFIAQHATLWLGTLSSNTCRVQNELRCGNGRYGVPYESLD